MTGTTARTAGLRACLNCEALWPLAGPSTCARCGADVPLRLPESLSRTLALLLAAAALYVPANWFPIMTVRRLGQGEPATILGGCQHLFESGMYGLAALIFFASVLVPGLKLVGLAYLVAMTHRRSRKRLLERTRLYHVIEIFGRWSMIDVFVIAILVALVQLGALARIEPGLGATFFCLVVVITMFASASFDPRMMWDVLEDPS